MKTQDPIHQEVQEYYGKVARESGSCCGPATGPEKIQNTLYPVELLSDLPTDVANFTAGSGDPISLAQLQPGETVLDLGSGGGLDCFLAVKQVGASGHVIGVDMTPEMLARARSSADRMQVRNVEFREGYLESMPVDDSNVDVIISNCVINLSPDKPQVFREMFRVLKPGGRIAVSDMVLNRALSEADRKDKEKWCGCTSGALLVREYVDELSKAGFTNIRVEPNVEAIINAIDSGQVRAPENLTKDQLKEMLLEDLRNWENAKRTMAAPHKITARKPV